MKITLDDLEALSLGAAVLGTGGGGDPYIGRLALKRQIELTSEPVVVPLEALADDAFVVPIGMAGSPAVALEKLLTESFADCVLRRFEEFSGRAVDAVMPIEIGGMNSLMPLLTACATGLPVIDADGMGRAFPSGDRTSFGVAGMSPFPILIMNEHLETVMIEASNPIRGEKITRTALVELGGAVIATHYPMSGRQAKDHAIPGTITLALGVGRAILAARREKTSPFEAILDYLRDNQPSMFGRVLFEGKVADVSRNHVGGYNIGAGTLEGSSDTATFSFQNEYLYLRQGDRPLAIVPDLVCFLDQETAEPVTCELLRYGQRVTVMGFSCAPCFRTEAGLAACGPGSFRLSDTYVPIEQLAG